MTILEAVKLRLNITGLQDDVILEYYIGAVESAVKTYTGLDSVPEELSYDIAEAAAALYEAGGDAGKSVSAISDNWQWVYFAENPENSHMSLLGNLTGRLNKYRKLKK